MKFMHSHFVADISVYTFQNSVFNLNLFIVCAPTLLCKCNTNETQ